MGAIGLEAVNAAAPIILWHTDQGRNYLGTANLSPDVANAAALDRWLIETARSEWRDPDIAPEGPAVRAGISQRQVPH